MHRIGCNLFEAVGCSPSDTVKIVDHLVQSSLFGHDSHGQLRFYEYIYQIREGLFQPTGSPRIEKDYTCAAVVNGGGALGQIGATFATQLAIEKARKNGIATITLRNTAHVGRVGAYPLLIADDGLVGLVFCNAGHMGRQIAPYGGIDGKLSTNPIAFAAPRRETRPLLVDMTTSVCAEGKIRISANKDEELPEGWILNSHGKPSTVATDYTGDPPGAILPLGGSAGYKGYCLSFIVEILGGALSGQGCASGEQRMESNGLCINAYSIEAFTDMDTYFNEIEALIRHVKSSRTDDATEEILVPGDPEYRMEEVRSRDGIPIDDETWKQIKQAAVSIGLDPTQWKTISE